MDYRFFSCVLRNPHRSQTLFWECSDESFKTVEEASDYCDKHASRYTGVVGTRVLEKFPWMPTKLSAWMQLDNPSLGWGEIYIKSTDVRYRQNK